MAGTAGGQAGGVGRRAVVLGAGGLLLGAAGCTDGDGGAPSPSPSSRAAGLPRTTPWRPGPGEVRPEVKLRAVQVVEALGNRTDARRATAAARLRALGLDPALAAQAGPLLTPGDAAALQVVYAQYGGLLADTASVMVVCRQWFRRGGTVTEGGTTVDVRLRRAEPRWTVTALHPARPGAPASRLPATARRVLADSRIGLPPAARADVRGGGVHASVLDAMLRLAGGYRFYVTVVRSGHPLDVFGTSRPSDHPPGRAFDVWQIDGRAVVDPDTPRSLIEGFMRAAAAAGSYNVGGPFLLGGGATPNQFFTDITHHDHVHVGFSV